MSFLLRVAPSLTEDVVEVAFAVLDGFFLAVDLPFVVDEVLKRYRGWVVSLTRARSLARWLQPGRGFL